jgi:hypothetical protein
VKRVTISITAEAFAAIEATLPKGTRGEPRADGKGGVLVVLSREVLDRLRVMRGAGESYSDVILRIAQGG